MVSSTFLRLNPAKQARINAALIEEFSRVPLAEAQVRNIVEGANIARGAFYKYFDSLDDAYSYTITQALVQLHNGLPHQLPRDRNELNEYVDRMELFLDAAEESDHFPLFVMHFRSNEERHSPTEPDPDLDPFTWQVSTLIHQTIRESMIDHDNRTAYVHRLREVLAQLNDDGYPSPSGTDTAPR